MVWRKILGLAFILFGVCWGIFWFYVGIKYAKKLFMFVKNKLIGGK